MKRFGYALDPLCLIACALYALNRWWWRDRVGGVFLHGYFNDLLLIPAALPVVLWVQRRCGLRNADDRPHWAEISLHTVAWSFAAEWIMPHLTSRATGDWKDVAAYVAGACFAGGWWQGARFA